MNQYIEVNQTAWLLNELLIPVEGICKSVEDGENQLLYYMEYEVDGQTVLNPRIERVLGTSREELKNKIFPS